MKKWQFIHVFIGLFVIICCNNDDKQINNFEQEQNKYLQPIVTQYLVCNKSEIWP